ncbi:hypothetical protein ACSQ76_16525 [Roseovarius sp. B08]|uniref:hypothetical protein n=1 Tax=Roseovarius sp. B08 TaxID=3449223 RepID=UPI003EDB91C0
MMQTTRIANVSRRSLLLGLGAGSLVLAVGLAARGLSQEAAAEFGADAMPNGWRDDPNVFVSIDEAGIVTVTIHRAEMGQGCVPRLPWSWPRSWRRTGTKSA